MEEKAVETILFVEDDIFIRMPIAQYLRDCGYKVIEAVSADEARAVLTEKQMTVDIVFSNIEILGAADGEMLSAADGIGLSKWIREHRPGLDVLLGGTVPRAIDSAKQLCGQGPVPKPYHPQTVHNRIRRLLASRSAASSGKRFDRDSGKF